MSTMSAREFNQDVSAAKRAAAEDGPLFITDRGESAFVLLTVHDYERLAEQRSVADWLQLDEGIEFEPPRLESFPRAADL